LRATDDIVTTRKKITQGQNHELQQTSAIAKLPTTKSSSHKLKNMKLVLVLGLGLCILGFFFFTEIEATSRARV
jgi:hypothetical protein